MDHKHNAVGGKTLQCQLFKLAYSHIFVSVFRCSELARRTKYFSYSDLAHLYNKVVLVRLRELSEEEFARAVPEDLRPLTIDDFFTALAECSPSTNIDNYNRLLSMYQQGRL